jgi:hypothetical protein
LDVPGAPEIGGDVPRFALACVVMTRKPDDRTSQTPVAAIDTAVSSQPDLQFGLCDDLEESPLKTVNPFCILYGNSLHFLSFQLLPVKSDNICKLAPEIKAETVFSAWFQAHFLTAIAEGPKMFLRPFLVEVVLALGEAERVAVLKPRRRRTYHWRRITFNGRHFHDRTL